jgi:hypothetical protein
MTSQSTFRPPAPGHCFYCQEPITPETALIWEVVHCCRPCFDKKLNSQRVTPATEQRFEDPSKPAKRAETALQGEIPENQDIEPVGAPI